MSKEKVPLFTTSVCEEEDTRLQFKKNDYNLRREFKKNDNSLRRECKMNDCNL